MHTGHLKKRERLSPFRAPDIFIIYTSCSAEFRSYYYYRMLFLFFKSYPVIYTSGMFIAVSLGAGLRFVDNTYPVSPDINRTLLHPFSSPFTFLHPAHTTPDCPVVQRITEHVHLTSGHIPEKSHHRPVERHFYERGERARARRVILKKKRQAVAA